LFSKNKNWELFFHEMFPLVSMNNYNQSTGKEVSRKDKEEIKKPGNYPGQGSI